MVNNSSSPTNPVLYFYEKYAHLLNHLQSIFLLVVRLVWGWQFVVTGWGKWQDISKVVGYFTTIGIPLPTLNAYMVATTELVGGTFLLLGLLSRLTTIPLIISMIVAYITTEQEALGKLLPAWGAPEGFSLGSIDPVLSAAPFLFLFASLIVFTFGPGKFSLDCWLLKTPRWKN